MKIPNKRELRKISSNHLSDIDFQYFMNLYKKCVEKPYSSLVIDTTLPSDNSSHFRKNLAETMQKLIMTTDVKLRMRNFNMILTEKSKNSDIIIWKS